MSHKAHIEVLAFHQPDEARSRTFVPAEVAKDLLQRMAAERINSGKIRMFSPTSIYLAGRQLSPEYLGMLSGLPPAEVENCKFVRAKSDPRPAMSTVREGWDWAYEPIPDDLVAQL